MSSGGGVGRILWRPEATCSESSLTRLVEEMRNRLGDPDLEIMREIRCDRNTGKGITDAVEDIKDEDTRWHDLESVREQLDDLDPPPPRLEFVADGDAHVCEWKGRSYRLTGSGRDWTLVELGSGASIEGTRALMSSPRIAIGWARTQVLTGWPGVRG